MAAPPPGPIDWLEHSKLLRRGYRGKYVILPFSQDNDQETDENGNMVFLGGWIPLTYKAFNMNKRYYIGDPERPPPGMTYLEVTYSTHLSDLNNIRDKFYTVRDTDIRDAALMWFRHREADVAITSENMQALFKWYVENIITHSTRADLLNVLNKDEKYYITLLDDFLMPEDIFSAQKLSMDISKEDEDAYSKEAQSLLDAAEDGMWLIRGSSQNRKDGITTLQSQGKRYYTLGIRGNGVTNLVRVEYHILTGWKIPGVLKDRSCLTFLARIERLDITKALLF